MVVALVSYIDLFFLLALIAVVAGGAFYAGWRAAAAYLPAARAVSDVSAAAVQQANGFAASLDKNEAALASLRNAVAQNTETLEARTRAVDDALVAIFNGFERAGLIRPAHRTPRQVGETPPADA